MSKLCYLYQNLDLDITGKVVTQCIDSFYQRTGHYPTVMIVRADELYYYGEWNGITIQTGTVQPYHFYLGYLNVERQPVIFNGVRRGLYGRKS